MSNTKSRSTLIALIVSASFAGASVVPGLANALPTSSLKGCMLWTGSVGTPVSDGQVIEVTVKEANGSETKVKLKCNNGKFETVKREAAPTTGVVAVGPILALPQTATQPAYSTVTATSSQPLLP